MARHHMELYLQLPDYTNNMIRLGFSDDDFRDGGSDHLVEALVAWGDVDVIAERVAAQIATVADSVCVQVLNGGSSEFPRQQYRDLAKVLI
jgi:mannose/cellobiose epimerase-like protein (N-acyl-D-glucosamine 2-epimerase family)